MTTQLQYASISNTESFPSLSADPIDVNLSGDIVLVSGVSGKKLYIYRLWLVVSGATVLTFKNGPATNFAGAIPMASGAGITFDISNLPWFQTSSGRDFILGSTNMVQISGVVYYVVNT